MIVDRCVQIQPSLHTLVRQATLIQVPFCVCPRQFGDELRWEEQRIPRGLVPKRSAEMLDGRFADPPYSMTILLGNTDESGFLIVLSQKADAETRLQLVSKDASIIQITPRWFVSAALIHILDGELVVMPTAFWIGEGLALLPSYKSLLSPSPRHLYEDQWYSMLRDIVWWHKNMGIPLVISRSVLNDPDEVLRRYCDALAGAAQQITLSIAVAFSLMNARNVCRVEAPAAMQSRSAKRRGDLPPYRYSIVKVGPLRVQNSLTIAGVTSAPVAIHWVRGHFKEYTAERPLFGNRVGLWWWQPFVAGQADRVVEKEYQIISSDA